MVASNTCYTSITTSLTIFLSFLPLVLWLWNNTFFILLLLMFLIMGMMNIYCSLFVLLLLNIIEYYWILNTIEYYWILLNIEYILLNIIEYWILLNIIEHYWILSNTLVTLMLLLIACHPFPSWGHGAWSPVPRRWRMAWANGRCKNLRGDAEKMRSDEDSHWKIRFRKILGKIPFINGWYGCLIWWKIPLIFH